MNTELINVPDVIKIGLISVLVIMFSKYVLIKMGYSNYSKDI